MKETTRLSYEPPVAKTLELNIEGIVCLSPGPYNSPFPGSGENW